MHGPGEPCLGGLGGVYLLAEPGLLIIDVFKRDLNLRGSPAELRAILAGPDRRVIQEATIPDDGQAKGGGPGPVQKTRLTAQVKHKGVFVLNVSVSQDRYGEEMVWGFATNCPRYLIETARGHKDEKHQEPIVLLGSDRPADVCFVPRQGPLTVDVSGLPASAAKLELFDAGGKMLREMTVAAGGSAAYTVPADVPRDRAPWRLHLPTRQAVIQIDGLTRWDGDDAHPDMCCWTMEPESFFPFPDYRWLLTPYSRVVYARPGKPAEAVFRIRNNGRRMQTVKLRIEFPGESWPVELSAGQVMLGGGQAAEVTVRGTAAIDGKPRLCHIRATPVEAPEFTTYSTLEVRAGGAPAASPLETPLVLKPYQNENELLGYAPDYPLDNQVYFDPGNRPFIAVAGGITTWLDGRWTTADLNRAMSPAASGGERRSYRIWGTKVAFDRDGGLYVLATAGTQAALLRSTDGGRTFAACPIPGREGQSQGYDIEQFSGHNAALEKGTPPPVVRFTLTESDPKLFWRRLNDLELFVPKTVDGRLIMGPPVLISRKSLGQSSHSGIPSCLVSRGGKIHVVWAEATPPGGECARRADVRGDLRQDDGEARPARAGGLRRPAQRRPQFAQHHDGQPRLPACPDRHAQQAVPVYAVAPAERCLGRLDAGGTGRPGPAADLHRPGVRPGRHAAPGLSSVALRRAAVPEQPSRDARLQPQAAGTTLGSPASARRPAVLGIQRVLPSPDHRLAGPAVSVV